jgi:uncharacterized membrane protein
MVRESLPQSPLLYVGVAPLSQRVERGGEVVYLITIENRSREAHTQSLSILGLAEAWYSVDFDSRRRVFPDEQRSAPLLIRVPQDAEPGDFMFQVIVTAGPAETGVACSLEVMGRPQPATPTPEPEPVTPAPTPTPEPTTTPVVEPTPPPIPGLRLAPAEVTWRTGATEPETLKVTVRNVGSADTTYTLRVDGLQPAWYTLPETLRVPARQAEDTELRIQPPARARLATYPFKVVAAAEGFADVRAEAEAQLTVAAREQTPRTQRTQRVVSPVTPTPTPTPTPAPATPVLPPDLSLAPRSTFRFGDGEIAAQATLTVQNKSRLIERYQISLEGIPEEWYSLGMSELRLEPGGSMPVPLRLTPRTGPSFPAGNYEFRIRVAPHSFPDSFAEVGGVLQISGVTSFDARLTPIQTAGRKEKFKLTLLNTGGLPFSPWVEATDPAGMCTFKFDPPHNLEVGQETVVPIWVGAKRNGFAGEAKTFDFRVRVSPAGGASSTARSFDARFVHEPFLSKNLFKYGIIAMIVASLLGLFLSFGTGSVSRAATVIRCGLNDTYEDGQRGVLIKQECGGALAPLQRGQAVAPTPTPGPDQPTAVPPQPTPDPGVCTPDPALGLAVGQAVTLRVDARIRESPGISGVDTGQRGLNRPGTITGGPVCANNLVWWEVDSGTVKGWTAEQDENKVQLIIKR